MNDRHAVEAILLPALMHSAIVQAVDREKSPKEYDTVIGLLQTAIATATRDMTLRERMKILRRTDRHRVEILQACPTTDELGLTIYVLMREISESVYEIGEDTPFFRATSLFLAALQHYAEDEALMQTAEERGKTILVRLREQGLYRI